MPTPFETLLTGDVLGGVIQAYTDIFSFWIYIIIFMTILGMVYYKSKNIAMVSVISLVVGTGLTVSNVFPPEGTAVLQIIVALSVAGTLYGVFFGRGR